MIRRLCSNNHKLDESSKSKSNDNAFDEHFDRRHKSFDNQNCIIDSVIKFIHKYFATMLKASQYEIIEGAQELAMDADEDEDKGQCVVEYGRNFYLIIQICNVMKRIKLSIRCNSRERFELLHKKSLQLKQGNMLENPMHFGATRIGEATSKY